MQTDKHRDSKLLFICCPVCRSQYRRTVLASRRADGVLVIAHKKRIYESTPGARLYSVTCDQCKSEIAVDENDVATLAPAVAPMEAVQIAPDASETGARHPVPVLAGSGCPS